jgi:hypothetical protein
MNKETLAKAKQLEMEIRQMETALGYYKRQRWGNWGVNDRASSMHFEYCKNWSGRDTDRQDLPKRLDAKLMAVVERELAVARQELDALGDDPEIITTRRTDDGVEYDPSRWGDPDRHKRKAPAPKALTRMADRMISWVIYSLLFCLLFCLAGWQYTTRELIALSLTLGFFAGSINNIERVLRELFEKKDKKNETNYD